MKSLDRFGRCINASRITVVGVLAIGLSIASLTALADTNDRAATFGWETLDSGSEADFGAIDVVSSDVAWIGSFASGLVLTVDGGASFTDITPPGYDPEWGSFVQDVEAWSAEDAIVVVGPDAETTAIYRTSDGGQNWTEVYSATLPAFINCVAMFDRRHGFAMGDPIDGEFQIIVTADAGRTWELAPATIPDPEEGEIGIATNGQCAASTGHKAFFGTWFRDVASPDKRSAPLAGETGRIFSSSDFGLTWEAATTAIPCCARSIDFRTNRLGLALGGYWEEEGQPNLAARTTDGGATWEPLSEPALEPIHIALAWWSDDRGDQLVSVPEAKKTVFAVGIDSVVSRDRGKTWEQFDDSLELYGIDCLEAASDCWAVGAAGTIAKLVVN